MHLSGVLLFFFSRWLLGTHGDVFTINDVKLEASLPNPVRNGAKLMLRCSADITKDNNFDLLHQFRFYKEDVLLYNEMSYSANAVLTINHTRMSSTGTYKCQVDVKSKTGSKELRVQVTGVSPPTIRIDKTEVKEGEDVLVRCEALEEEPPLEFTFYKTKDSKMSSTTKKSRDTNAAELNFPIEKGDKILHIQCDVVVVFFPHERSNRSSSKIVTVTEPFSNPTIQVFPSSNFTEGINMSIKCSVQIPQSVSDPVEIVIQKDKQILKSSTSGTVVFSQLATVKHMGNYTCKAELKKAWKSSSVSVTIAELFQRPRLQGNMKTDMNEGDLLSLTCAVPNLSVESAKNQSFYLSKGGDFPQKMFAGGRYWAAVKEVDSGSYVCEVTISNITKTSDPVTLRVHAPVSKPVLKQLHSNTTKVVLGDTLTLSCLSITGTLPLTYSLYRGSEFVSRVTSYMKTPAIFTINVTKSDDLGNYRCHAANRNTHSMENPFSDAINITVITPVKNVQLFTIQAQGIVEEESEVSLVCTADNGSLPIEFKLYRDGRLRRAEEVYSHSKAFIIESFTKEEDGSYYCTASNMAIQDVLSSPVPMKAVLARWKKGILSTVIVFIILAVIGIAIYFYLDKKKKGLDSTSGVNLSEPLKSVELPMALNLLVQSLGHMTAASEIAAVRSGSLRWLKGRGITLDKSRSINSADVNYDKATLELKNEDSYYGSNQNEDENHVLRSTEESTENDQDHQEVEYTEVEVDAASPQRAPVPKTTDIVYSEIARSNHDADLNNANMTTDDSPSAN